MHALDSLYTSLLHFGLLSLRHAIQLGETEWAKAEVDFLHNVPSLLGEPNAERHRYFWFTERQLYIEWVHAQGREEVRSRMATYYEPIWRDMETLVLAMLESPAGLAFQTPGSKNQDAKTVLAALSAGSHRSL